MTEFPPNEFTIVIGNFSTEVKAGRQRKSHLRFEFPGVKIYVRTMPGVKYNHQAAMLCVMILAQSMHVPQSEVVAVVMDQKRSTKKLPAKDQPALPMFGEE